MPSAARIACTVEGVKANLVGDVGNAEAMAGSEIEYLVAPR
jgi:hypothetical protein